MASGSAQAASGGARAWRRASRRRPDARRQAATTRREDPVLRARSRLRRPGTSRRGSSTDTLPPLRWRARQRAHLPLFCNLTGQHRRRPRRPGSNPLSPRASHPHPVVSPSGAPDQAKQARSEGDGEDRRTRRPPCTKSHLPSPPVDPSAGYRPGRCAANAPWASADPPTTSTVSSIAEVRHDRSMLSAETRQYRLEPSAPGGKCFGFLRRFGECRGGYRRRAKPSWAPFLRDPRAPGPPVRRLTG